MPVRTPSTLASLSTRKPAQSAPQRKPTAAPQPLDDKALRQVGGGLAPNLPNRTW